MVITSKLFISQELILTDLVAKDKEEVINALGKQALNLGCVEQEFLANILEREKVFPTGLEMGLPIAIPHIREGCKKSFISIATLKTPVVFNAMEDFEREIAVELVFMFGITNPEDQVEVLKKLVEIFQNRDNLLSIKNELLPKGVLKKLNGLMGEYLDIKNGEGLP